jgi:1-acyl-sn-glycerol-3-phosphate acyltransferase
MGEPYRADYRGPVFHFFWPLTRYLTVHITVLVLGLLFYVLNRATVIGRGNVPRERNTLLLSNHQTMIDSFLVGTAAYFGPATLKPYLIPWNPAAEENFFKNPFWAWWADNWKCIPVKAGRRDSRALHRMIRALKRGTMILFPEGTRSRDGKIRQGRAGAGLVILANHPNVVPVTVDGLYDVLPVGCRLPRLFKRIWLAYGKPIDYSKYVGLPRSKETAQAIVDDVIEVLRHQLEGLRRLQAGEIDRKQFERKYLNREEELT